MKSRISKYVALVSVLVLCIGCKIMPYLNADRYPVSVKINGELYESQGYYSSFDARLEPEIYQYDSSIVIKFKRELHSGDKSYQLRVCAHKKGSFELNKKYPVSNDDTFGNRFNPDSGWVKIIDTARVKGRLYDIEAIGEFELFFGEDTGMEIVLSEGRFGPMKFTYDLN